MTDRDAIEEQVRRFVAAYHAGDIDGLMACYAPELVKLRNGAPAEHAIETRRRVLEGMRLSSRRDLVVENDEITVSGDMAYVRGRLTITVSESQQTVRRRFLEIWRKIDGQWLVTRTMDNIE